MESSCGIYRIVNKINGKCYVGQSIDIEARLSNHFKRLRANNHRYRNNSLSKLQKAYNKYGEDSFLVEVVETCDKDILDEREIYWIEFYDSFNSGYNSTIGGESVRGLRFEHSDITKKRMSENHLDFSGSKNPMYGKHHSEESRITISKSVSKAMTGRVMSDEFKETMREVRKGIVHTESEKAKISDSRKNKRWINNGIDNKYVSYSEIDTYLTNGWKLGMFKRKKVS